MCEICKKVHSRAQHNARERILKRESEKIAKKLAIFQKTLERKYFPEKISCYGAISKHTFGYVNKSYINEYRQTTSFKDFKFQDITKPLKEKNLFYSFPLWAPNYKIIWIPENFFDEKIDAPTGKRIENQRGIFYYPGLFYNPSKEIIKYLKKNGTEVQFPSAK